MLLNILKLTLSYPILDVHDTELSFSRGMSNTSDRPAAHATDDSSINPAAGSQEANVAFESVIYRRPALASASADSRYFEVWNASSNVDLCDTASLLSKGLSIASDRPVAAAGSERVRLTAHPFVILHI